MNHIDVLDKTITINGQAIDFPMSYEEIKKVLGNARIVEDTSGKSVQTSYYYDELGIEFDGSPAYLSNLKKKKAYKDNDHNIVGLTLYVSGNIIYDFKEEKCEKKYVGNLTVLGNQIDRSKTYRGALGFGYCPLLDEKGKDKKHIQVSISIISTSESVFTVDDDPFYDGDVLLRC